MALRKILVGVLTFIMVSPAWGLGEPLGNITFGSDSTVRGTTLTPGSTVFNDDVIRVEARGAARIALAGGAQAEVLGNSTVRLTRSNNDVQMVVESGQASFRTAGDKKMTALVADATVRPVNGDETSAIIQVLSPNHAVVAAQKGALLIGTPHDGKVYTVPEGEAADLSASADPQQTPVPAGKSSTPTLSSISHKKIVYITVIILGAGVALTAYFLARGETNQSTNQLQNEISPATLH